MQIGKGFNFWCSFNFIGHNTDKKNTLNAAIRLDYVFKKELGNFVIKRERLCCFKSIAALQIPYGKNLLREYFKNQ